MDYVVIDMETNGLLYEATKIHCIVLKDSNGVELKYHDSTLALRDGSAADGIMKICQYAASGYLLVGHNIIGYDFPLLKKHGYNSQYLNPFDNPKIVDTYIGVSLMYPEELPGLEYWGRKLGKTKPPIEDWNNFSVDMLERCAADVEINDRLFGKLCADGYTSSQWAKAIKVEQEVLWIHAQQTLQGMRVDKGAALAVIKAIDTRLNVLEGELYDQLPDVCQGTGPVNRPFLKDGGLSKMTRDYFDGTPIVPISRFHQPVEDYDFPEPEENIRIGGPFTRIHFEPVNLNSHPKMKEILLGLGWQPTEYNRKREDDGTWTTMSPKLTEDSYASLPAGLGQDLAEYLMLRHRRRFIIGDTDPTKGLLGHLRDDGRVACDAFTCGTNTGRYRHSGAFVNLPKVTTVFGPEIRGLFTVHPSNWLIGADLDGIEARMMGHFAHHYDGGAYAKVVLTGDVHTANAKALGVDRETAKTFLYAISYGAGEAKLAGILNCSVAIAKRKIDAYWKANHGLAVLTSALEGEYSKNGGWITGIDGRKLFIRHKHKLLNTLIQNAATVVFKRWMVECHKAGYASIDQLLAYHDELAWECIGDLKHAEIMAEKLCGLTAKVSHDMRLHVPITADWKVGKKYSEVH